MCFSAAVGKSKLSPKRAVLHTQQTHNTTHSTTHNTHHKSTQKHTHTQTHMRKHSYTQHETKTTHRHTHTHHTLTSQRDRSVVARSSRARTATVLCVSDGCASCSGSATFAWPANQLVMYCNIAVGCVSTHFRGDKHTKRWGEKKPFESLAI
jgi:hypothetical protein